MTRPSIVGHRGLCIEPENTLKAFKKAIEMKVDMIELDVRLTRDKVPIVMHDDDVDRTTNGRGKVCEMSLKEIKKLDAGDGEQVPTLQEVIDLAKGKTKMLVELKSYGAIKPVAKIIKSNQIEDSVVVASFGHIISKAFKKMLPEVKTGIQVVSLPIDPLKMVYDANADYLISFYETLLAGSLFYKKIIKQANKKSINVLAAEVDCKSTVSSADIKQLTKLGVNGFILNNPGIAIKHFEPKKKMGFW